MGGDAPDVETHPDAFAWYTLVARFSDEVRGSWTDAPAADQNAGKKGGKGGKKGGDGGSGGKAGGKAGGKGGKGKPAAAAAAAAEEDEMDLFGEDPAADAAAAEALKKK